MKNKIEWQPVGFSSIEHALMNNRKTYCGLDFISSHRLEHFKYRRCKKCDAALRKEQKKNENQ